MGAWNEKLGFQLLLYTVMCFVISFENLQVLTSAMIIPSLTKPTTNSSFNETEWTERKAKCRFGHLQNDGYCRCRNAECSDFKVDLICMERDSGNHRTWKNPCYMIEHACNARKKRLYYWKGECRLSTGEPKEVAGEYCEGNDVSYCRNDGICKYHSTTNERRCICKRGFVGSKCQHKMVPLSRMRRYYALRRLRRTLLRFRARRSIPENYRTSIYNTRPS